MIVKTETIVGLFMLTAIAVFVYMSFKIGICRLDTVRYAQYTTYFKDVSGLREKADVSIAGVRVGWVDRINLVGFEGHVRVDLMIDRNCLIYSDAYGTVRQDGLLGTKYIEINPGDSLNPTLPAGSTLMFPNKSPVAIDEILSVFKEIATNVQEVTLSLKNIVGDDNNINGLRQLLTDAGSAFRSIHDIAETSNSIVKKNDAALTSLIHDFSFTVADLKQKLPNMISDLQEKISVLADSLKDTGSSFKSILDPIQSISKKLNNNEGLLGTLINDPTVAEDFSDTIGSVKRYFNYAERIALNVDTHVESMQAPGNDLDFKDAKGYINLVMKVSDDLSYVFGVTSAYSGVVRRKRIDTMWMNQEKHPMVPDLMEMDNWAKLYFAPVKEEYVRDYSALTYNIQFEKAIGRLKFRTGLFESTFGMGMDYDVLLKDDIRWISSFELYRFDEFMSQTLGGRMIFDIDLPHLKWYNRIFINDSCYFVFGADDFISKFNRNFFAGFGLSFEQNDLKYLLGRIK